MVETVHDALVVPSQAVLDRKTDDLPKKITENNPNITPGNTFARIVYRVEDIPGKATRDGKPLRKTIATPVQVGSSDLTRTVIYAGLKEGDAIVVGPFKALQSMRNEQEIVAEGDADTPKDTKTTDNQPPKDAQQAGS